MTKNPYCSILAKLKKNKGASATELAPSLPQEYHSTDSSPAGIVLNFLAQLMRFGLVEAYDNGGLIQESDISTIVSTIDAKRTRFYISPLALEIEQMLHIDLTATFNPVFGKPQNQELAPDVFLLMPFLSELTPVYTDHINMVCEEFKLTVKRADDFFSIGSIMNDVWSAIVNSKIIIADCTGRNPNVFYEIGISHTVGRNTVLIAQSEDDIPFDLRHLRVIIYKFTPRGMAEFEEKLKTTIGTIINEKR